MGRIILISLAIFIATFFTFGFLMQTQLGEFLFVFTDETKYENTAGWLFLLVPAFITSGLFYLVQTGLRKEKLKN